jgi:hypothetical protein
MNLLQKFASGLAVLVACSAAQGATLTYDYSYRFLDGESILGTFTGVESGGLVTNIGNITGHISAGGPNAGYVFHDLLAGSYNGSISHTGAVVSLDGLHSNFFFTNATDTNWFYVFPNASNTGSLEQARLDFDRYIDFDNRFYVAANFHVVAEAGTDPGTVPEPGSIALLGLGLAGLAAARRKWAR